MSSRRFSVANLVKRNNDEASKADNIKVVVRVRPPNVHETGTNKVVQITDNYMLTFDPKEKEISYFMENKCTVLDKRIRNLQFTFDRIFNESSSNDEVFLCTTKPAIDSLLQGYNCSVFAYGATAAGKTHTMLGSHEQPGVIFLTMMDLYKRMMTRDAEYEADISVSYLEIYNETCKDLLLPKGALAVREDPGKGVCVQGLSLHKPRSAEELLEMLHFGNQNRTQHPTDANQQSSRSHAVFQVFVRQCPKTAGLSADVILSKMSLIDLAGSERATVTKNSGDRLREGANINKSLLALGNCINALAENKSKIHIPYRNSKLTRLLKDSIGGNCKTIMIAAVSPSTLSYEDTYNTLKYANRAKNIKSSLKQNKLQVNYHVSQYGQIVEDLKTQITLLKNQIETMKDEKQISSEEDAFHKDMETFKRFEDRVDVLFKEKEKFKSSFVDCEAQEKELTLKLLYKKKSYMQLKNSSKIVGEEMVVQSLSKLEELRSACELRKSKLTEQKTMLGSSMKVNTGRINALQCEVEEWNGQVFLKQHLHHMFHTCNQVVENSVLKVKSKHVRKCFLLAEAHFKKTETMITILEANQKSPTSKTKLAEDLPHMDDTQVKWADQNGQQKGENVVDFNTPFKTPSKKPGGILKRLAMHSTGNKPGPPVHLLTNYNTQFNMGRPTQSSDLKTDTTKKTASEIKATATETKATSTETKATSTETKATATETKATSTEAKATCATPVTLKLLSEYQAKRIPLKEKSLQGGENLDGTFIIKSDEKLKPTTMEQKLKNKTKPLFRRVELPKSRLKRFNSCGELRKENIRPPLNNKSNLKSTKSFTNIPSRASFRF